MALVIQPTFENAVLLIEDHRRLFVQYVNLRDLWSLCRINQACSFYFYKYAQLSASTDTLDSFFENDEFDSILFLSWCDKNNILMKRLFLFVSSDDSTKYSLDLLNAFESYLKKMGSKVIAISFKFTCNCIAAAGLITLAFKCCPNLKMFSLDGGLLHFYPNENIDILAHATWCHSLRDWVFVGRNPLINNEKDYKLFGAILQGGLTRKDEVFKLFISIKQEKLQACQYTFAILEAMDMDKSLRISNIRNDTSSDLNDDVLLKTVLRDFPRASLLSIDWIPGGNMLAHSKNILILSIWGLRRQDLGWDLQLVLNDFFESHNNGHGYIPVQLGLHMTDHSSHRQLFGCVKDILALHDPCLRSLDISVESENTGVMSLYPVRTQYIAPGFGFSVLQKMIKKIQDMYTVDVITAESRLHEYGQLDRDHMLSTFPEFEDFHTEYNKLMENHGRAENQGLLATLISYMSATNYRDIFRQSFRRLVARGFDYNFRCNDIMRLESVPFRVDF